MTLTIELVTPEALMYSSNAQMVVVPGIEGDFGVLGGHAPMISSLRPGIIDVYETGGSSSKSFYIAEGFAQVSQEQCTILARRAVDVTGNPDEAARLLGA